MSEINYINLDLSPLEDEGIDYIWFARYLKGNLTKFEANNDKAKLKFESIYNDRNLIREFGMIGKSRKIGFYLNDGLFKTNNQDVMQLYIEDKNNKITNISNNMDCVYSDIITKKHIVGVGEEGIPIIYPISFGYNTEIKYQDGIIKATVLYDIHSDHDTISVYLESSIDLEESNIVLIHPYSEFRLDKVKLNKIDDTNYEAVIQV